MALVEVNSVSKSYPWRSGMRTNLHAVVEDVSFSIDAGETLGLVGESGSGKTTVARNDLGPREANERRDPHRRYRSCSRFGH